MSLTKIQLDYILEKTAAEDPEHWAFYREGAPPKKLSHVESAIMWERVLTGKDARKMMTSHMPPEAVLQKLRELHKHSTPVIRRKQPSAKN